MQDDKPSETAFGLNSPLRPQTIETLGYITASTQFYRNYSYRNEMTYPKIKHLLHVFPQANRF